ncbi:MAG: hypothetical protein FK732_04035 [Asgard group archaeon]|nr:hypothetical protein [Asgard group archaeon]
MKDHNCFSPDNHKLLNGRILVKIPELSDKMENGIYLPSTTLSKEQNSVIKGELVAFNEFAFADRRLQPDGSYSYVEWKEKPEIGDIVYFELYCGLVLFTEDKKRYRSMPSTDLTGFEKQNKE